MSKQLTVIEAVRMDLSKMKPQIQAAIGGTERTVDKFIRVAITSVQVNPKLAECNRASLYGAWMKSAQAGLLPDGKEAAIVPYKGNATFQPMIAGLMKLVRNSGEIATWSIRVVKENDQFHIQYGDDERIIHRPAMKDRGNTVGAYSIVTLRSGEKSRDFMSLEDLEKIRKRSPYGDKGPWVSDTDEMYKKTVGKRHYKVLPSSTDADNDRLSTAMETDDDTISVQSSVVDEVPDKEPAQIEAPKVKQSRLASVVEKAKVI